MTNPSQENSAVIPQELAELKRQLQSQLALLRDERLEELAEQMQLTTRRLQGLSDGGAAVPAEFAAEVAEIRTLHTELELALADRLTDTRDRLTHLNKGRRVLRAYRG